MVMGIDVPKKRKGASFSVDPRLHQFTYIEGMQRLCVIQLQ
jgi:hypothetical protein